MGNFQKHFQCLSIACSSKKEEMMQRKTNLKIIAFAMSFVSTVFIHPQGDLK